MPLCKVSSRLLEWSGGSDNAVIVCPRAVVQLAVFTAAACLCVRAGSGRAAARLAADLHTGEWADQ